MVAIASVLERVNPLDEPGWDAQVSRLPGATFFHSAAWARVLHETYGYRPIYFVEKRTDGGLAALVPVMEVDSWLTGRRGISLPFTDECAPLADTPETARRIVRAIDHEAEIRRWRYWEVRGGNSTVGAPASVAFYGHSIALGSDAARLFSQCESAVRWAVRKAELTELAITMAHDLDAVRTFHGLVCSTRKRQGLPPQPWAFFENIHRHALARGQGCVVLAYFKGQAVAGSLFLHFGKSAIFKFGASDARFHPLRPNNLVMWRAIEWHAHAGFEHLDFGRTSLANKGLRHFKLGWGTTERRIEYARFDRRVARFVTIPDQSSGWHNRLFKLLPAALARVIGAAAYRHVA